MKKNEERIVTILLVDDKPANLLSLEQLLEKRGRVFLTAACGTEALKIAYNCQIDLIILDVQMPDIDGFEVAQILQSNRKTKDIPIIFASAEKKEHTSMIKGFEEGAVDYLFKPLDPEITRAKVSVLLKIQLQKKELIENNLSLEKSALLINNSADIIGILDTTTWRFEEVNLAFTTILGYSPEEAREVSMQPFLHTNDQTLMQAVHEQGRNMLSFETLIYCKDNSTKWLHWHVVAKDKMWFVNARDITELKQVEKIRNYLATVVKQSDDAIYIHNQEGKIISWNEGAERIYGYTEEEALKMQVWSIIPPGVLPESKKIINQIIKGKKISSRETRRIGKSGRQVDVLFSASIITDVDDHQISIAVTERDITKQKLADESIVRLNKDLEQNIMQLRETNNQLESFSYSVSHDLRAPLRAIQGNARIIEEDYVDKLDNYASQSLGRIIHNAERMNTLINDLLAFSRLGKKEVRRTHISMNDMIYSILAEIRESIPHKAEVVVRSLPPAFADHGLMHQVLTNLISNAIKYSSKKEKPYVEIGSKSDNDEIVYYVKDNGAGFDMNYAEKLFGAFQRLHPASEFEGTGIGLAIVHRIIVKHYGRIWADAKPEKGATFFFTIPEA